jgi:hypothetical protein
MTKKEKTMKIENRKIETIAPYFNNPRNNDSAVSAVIMSLQEFGWQQPIVVDKDGVIVVGHTRYKAAKILRMKTVPVVVMSGKSPEQIQAYRIADNRTGELADWDKDLLDIEIQDLSEVEFDLELTGFNLEDFGLNDNSPKKTKAKREAVEENFLVVVECKNESEQLSLLTRFQTEGIKCKALIS